MNITVETNFNIGDEVFPIAEEIEHNDWYSTGTCWRVKTEDIYSENKEPLRIRTIKLDIWDDCIEVKYNIDFSIYKERDIFKTYEEAQEECKRLNSYMG